MDPKKINYLYFGFYSLLLLLLTLSSIFTKPNPSPFFLLYAMGQISLEVAVLIFLAVYIDKWFHRRAFLLFLGATFLLLTLHICDFLMDRILDISVWGAIDSFLLQESFSNLLLLLDASGISLWLWVVLLAVLLLLPILGIFTYRISSVVSEKKPWHFRKEPFLLSFLCLPIALFLWDFSASKTLHPNMYEEFLHTLPWKTTFLPPQKALFPLPASMKKIAPESTWKERIEQHAPLLEKKPNIYLFVAESLRRDILDPAIAPHLVALEQQSIPIQLSLSNGNGTHLSWFSLFHSQYAYHWKELQQRDWSMGAPPLALLKKLGYKIHLYSSADLKYYSMDTLLFGKNLSLLDTHHLCHASYPQVPADGDATALHHLLEDLPHHTPSGNLYLLFWDASHFDYSWPSTWSPPFTPFAKDTAFFHPFYSEKALQKMKNRYKNAIAYLDHLFATFLSRLPKEEESWIVFLGDHGEEFFESGHLFHNSHLSKEQTHIPLLLHLGKETPKTPISLASQVDVFPTLIHALTGQIPSHFAGQSLLQPQKDYTVLSRFFANQIPKEFCIQKKETRCIVSSSKSPFEASSLHVRLLEYQGSSPYQLPEREALTVESFGSAIYDLLD